MLHILLWSVLVLFIVLSMAFVIKSKRLKNRALRKVAAMNTKASENWTVDFLEKKRKLTDDLADNTVSEIMEKKEVARINQLFQMITRDDNHLPADAPDEIKEYFRKTAVLPDWADQDLIDLGQQIYIRHGIWISLLLSNKSLPECYACAKGAEVLHRTARLDEQQGSMETFSRRIAETAQFVVFAMSPGGLSPNGRGLVAAQKVRLIHAVIRYHLRKQNWDPALYDEPINQEDMAGTLMSFSALILQGMEQLGIVLEPVEKEAYIHCWRVIGHVIGLHDDIIPENSDDALKLGNSILDHQIARSKQGSELMKALLEFQDKNAKAIMSSDTNIAMVRLMMGSKISDLLDVPGIQQNKIDKLSLKIKRIANAMEKMDQSMVFAMLLQFITKYMSLFMINHMTKSKIINFYIPRSLRSDWMRSKS
ncbi:MAG: oxygenase MpaB family protein [Bacteroidota bacterium]